MATVTESTAVKESPARRRILDTATALFYGEGVHSVGVDRIIAEAGVAKATFYHHFPAKDDLVRSYLDEQYARQREAFTAVRARALTPQETITAIFDFMIKFGAEPGYRGCPFINVAAEYPDPQDPVRQVVEAQRVWTRATFRELLAAAGDPEPDRAAGVLMLLRDGVAVGSDLDDTEALRAATRDAVTRVLA
ncbi:TetR/AcrR family transcriptional regulator [Hamadaea sp. NPDC051192]|uniref:TetR/AcrR family transcriptional regulator n=1 Tax=Hamadaea sp. NPDC051192 TaxID=3154940 RepID=UPI00341CE4D5